MDRASSHFHCFVVFIRGKLFFHMCGLVCEIIHDHNYDVEGIHEEIVNHLEIGSPGDHLINAALDIGNDKHSGDGDHYPVLEVVYSVVECHVGHS